MWISCRFLCLVLAVLELTMKIRLTKILLTMPLECWNQRHTPPHLLYNYTFKHGEFADSFWFPSPVQTSLLNFRGIVSLVFILLACEYFACMPVCASEGLRSPGMDGCEPPWGYWRGYWKQNLGPPEEQPVLLTPSYLSSPKHDILNVFTCGGISQWCVTGASCFWQGPFLL